MFKRIIYFGAVAILFALISALCVAQQRTGSVVGMRGVSDQMLVKSMPGFANSHVETNGTHIHFVAGGRGSLIVLLPGWPETWWAYRKIMPSLAKTHRVIAVDLRGMGSSGHPLSGYDKKTMAEDVSGLIHQLRYDKAVIVGHDIGAMVAFSLAENHPEQVEKLVMLDTSHPSPAYLTLPLLPPSGTFGDKVDDSHPYFWWFAFHQVQGLPEDLLTGRADIEQRWFFHYMLKNPDALDPRDRAVYAKAYATRASIRASDAWYQNFDRDIQDYNSYGLLSMPVLGVGGPAYIRLKAMLDVKAPGSTTVHITDSGHFIAEEKPLTLLSSLDDFLK